jgi:hypothetical protein
VVSGGDTGEPAVHWGGYADLGSDDKFACCGERLDRGAYDTLGVRLRGCDRFVVRALVENSGNGEGSETVSFADADSGAFVGCAAGAVGIWDL